MEYDPLGLLILGGIVTATIGLIWFKSREVALVGVLVILLGIVAVIMS